jgi:hypothetical protein
MDVGDQDGSRIDAGKPHKVLLEERLMSPAVLVVMHLRPTATGGKPPDNTIQQYLSLQKR